MIELPTIRIQSGMETKVFTKVAKAITHTDGTLAIHRDGTVIAAFAGGKWDYWEIQA